MKKVFFPNTEPCTVLKLLTREPGRMPVGAYINGTIEHDSEEHYTFIEDSLQDKKPVNVQRNPRVFKGEYINIVRMEDGTMRPTFKYPRYKDGFGFQDFCKAATHELLMISCLLGEKVAT